jgi:hypothetical protein
MKTNKYHIAGTFPNSNRKILEKGRIDTSNTQMYGRSLSWLDICPEKEWRD